MSESETYANNIDNANALMRNYKQGAYEAANEAATSQLEQFQTKAAELRDKYGKMATEGGGEIGGVYAVHHLIKRIKAYRDGKSKKKAEEKDDDEDGEEEGEGEGEGKVGEATTTTTEPAVEPKFGESTIGEGTAPEDSVFNLIKSDPARFGVADDTPVETSAQRVARRLKELDEPTKPDGAEGAEDVSPDIGGGEGGGGAARAAQAGRGVASDATDLGAAGEGSDASAFAASSASDGLSGTNTISQKVVTDFRSATGDIQGGAPELDINSGAGGAGGGGAGGGGAAAEAPVASGAPPPPKVVPKQTPAELEQTEIQNKIQGADAEDPFGEMPGSLLDGTIGEGVGGGLEGGVMGAVESSTLLDAIPLVGEGAAIIQGLVGIGEGIYHLLKGDSDKPPPPPPIVIGRTPAEVSSKFSAALPSADGSVEDQAGQSGTF